MKITIYIKLTRSNDDDDSWKHLKYFCLTCHIWREIYNLSLRLEFKCKCIIGCHYFLVTQIADRSQTSAGLSVYVTGGLHKVPTLPVTVLLAKPILYVPLNKCKHLQYLCFLRENFQTWRQWMSPINQTVQPIRYFSLVKRSWTSLWFNIYGHLGLTKSVWLKCDAIKWMFLDVTNFAPWECIR